MKKFSQTLIKGMNWMLLGILTLLGFPNCKNTSADEYGTPYAEYVIKGKVVGEKENPLIGIPVIVRAEFTKKNGVILDNYHLYTDTVYTDQQGEYIQQRTDFPSELDMTVIANGVEEKNDATYATDSIKFNITGKDFSGGDGWYRGKVEKTAPTVKLGEKKTDE